MDQTAETRPTRALIGPETRALAELAQGAQTHSRALNEGAETLEATGFCADGLNGGGGIRTHGSSHFAGFQDRSHQPLDHPSKPTPTRGVVIGLCHKQKAETPKPAAKSQARLLRQSDTVEVVAPAASWLFSTPIFWQFAPGIWLK